MSKKLPYLTRSLSLDTKTEFSFSGINRAEGVTEGAVYDTLNMTSDYYPAIGTRPKRKKVFALPGKAVYGIGFSKKMYYCAEAEDGKAYFYYDGAKMFEVAKNEKTFAVINSYICVFPDKMYFSEKFSEAKANYDTIEALHDAFVNSATVADGDIYSVGGTSLFSYNSAGVWAPKSTAKNAVWYYNSQTEWIYISEKSGPLGINENIGYTASQEFKIEKSSTDSGYDTILSYNDDLNAVKVGNAVKLIAQYVRAGTNTRYLKKSFYAKLSKIEPYGSSDYVKFIFSGLNIPVAIDKNGNETSLAAAGTLRSVRVQKSVPDFTAVFCHKNRLWGCEEGKLYASALGDPTEFADYSSSASGAWAWQSADSAPFTGGCSFSGYPTFFKERKIIKIAGDYPAEYATYETDSVPGVKAGCGESLAAVGSYLYYVSGEGVMKYGGSFPQRAGTALGDKETSLSAAVGGAGKSKYYISSKGETFVLDTVRGFWMKEDESKEFTSFSESGGDLIGLSGSEAWKMNSEETESGEKETAVPSEIVFSPCFDGTLDKKGVSRININLYSEGTAKVYISYDGAGYQKVWESPACARVTYNIPILIRRASMYNIKISSTGRIKLYAVTKTRYRGSDLK